MKTSNAYDLPLRIFHWVFAMLFASSFYIAKVIDDDSALYVYHMLSGLIMTGLILLRVIWGFWGPKTARFSSFPLSINELINYFTSLFSHKTKRYLGHNPASSYAAIVMFIFTLGLATTGILMSLRINKHFFEDIHELAANGFIILVIIHIVGVIFHQIKHKDGMAFSMINGKKQQVLDEEQIESNHPIVATILIVLLLSMGFTLNKGYDPTTGKLSLLGVSLQLGDSEDHEGHNESKNGLEHHEEDDDD